MGSLEESCCPSDSTPPAAAATTNESLRGTDVSVDGIEGAAPISVYVTISSQQSSVSANEGKGAESEMRTKKAVIVASDVYGAASGHHRRFCDELADQLGENWLVLLPDLFRGKPILSDWGGWRLMQAFALPRMVYRIKSEFSPENIVERDIGHTLLPWLASEHGISGGETNVAIVGFCFGGWVVGKTLSLLALSCGVGVHPSFHPESIHGSDAMTLARQIGSKPLLFLPAAHDPATFKTGGEVVGALAKARGVDEGRVTVAFETMRHGWVSRGDDANDADVAKEQARALWLTSRFLLEHCN